MDTIDTQSLDEQIAQLQEQVATAQRYITQIQNVTGQSIGTTAPTITRSGISVLPVQSVSASVVNSSVGHDDILVTWISPVDPKIDHYNVYIQRSMTGQNPLVLVSSVSDSPAVFDFMPNKDTSAVIYVQTVLTNGQVLPIQQCPSTAVNLVSPTVPPAHLHVSCIFVNGLTLTDNSPSAGNIAWSSCTVTYQGTDYSVASGNTTAGNGFVTWTIGSGTFSQVATYTPGPTIFLIATNNLGTSDVAWNKIGHSGILRTHLSFGLLVGLTIQPQAFVANVSCNTPGADVVTNILTVNSGGGALLTVGFTPSALFGNPTDTLSLRTTIDGGTSASYTIYAGGATGWAESARMLSQLLIGDGTSMGDIMNFYLGVAFETSISVDIVVHANGGGGGTPTTIDVAALYAIQN